MMKKPSFTERESERAGGGKEEAKCLSHYNYTIIPTSNNSNEHPAKEQKS